mmetsp:Transcript_78041/g.216789  ORF Transcript_78041/g.216789 Transcript_78041/m.216789 type:complete len:101 (-) Transcript_78041:96-398(-)
MVEAYGVEGWETNFKSQLQAKVFTFPYFVSMCRNLLGVGPTEVSKTHLRTFFRLLDYTDTHTIHCDEFLKHLEAPKAPTPRHVPRDQTPLHSPNVSSQAS